MWLQNNAKTRQSQKEWCYKPTKFANIILKRYESTKIDINTWLHVTSGTYGPQEVTLTKWLKYKKRLC